MILQQEGLLGRASGSCVIPDTLSHLQLVELNFPGIMGSD